MGPAETVLTVGGKFNYCRVEHTLDSNSSMIIGVLSLLKRLKYMQTLKSSIDKTSKKFPPPINKKSMIFIFIKKTR